MTKHEIVLLRNFHRNEKDIFGREIFENYSGIEYDLMEKVDKLVSFAKQTYGESEGALIVHDINLGTHTTGSLHDKGKAIDGHFRGLNLFQIAQLLFKFRFGGIGLYPDWKKRGFHADIRNSDRIATWVYHKKSYNYDWNYFVEQLEIEMECGGRDG